MQNVIILINVKKLHYERFNKILTLEFYNKKTNKEKYVK